MGKFAVDFFDFTEKPKKKGKEKPFEEKNNAFLTSTTAENFPQLNDLSEDLIGVGGFIAGGAFKNIFLNEEARDIDIFFRSVEDWQRGIEVMGSKGFLEKYVSANSAAYEHPETGAVYDLVGTTDDKKQSKLMGEPHEVIRQFDFTVSKFALFENLEKGGFSVTYHRKYFEHLLLKRLVIDDDVLHNPFSTFQRAMKYSSYGFKLTQRSANILAKEMAEEGYEGEEQLSKSMYGGVE